jgi:hypothetical protein
MSASPLRKAKKRVMSFTLVFEAQEMIVTYHLNWMADTGHFEFRSPHEPARRIPVSSTGYCSYFASMEDIEAASSPQDDAREVVQEMLRPSRSPPTPERDQLRLF